MRKLVKLCFFMQVLKICQLRVAGPNREKVNENNKRKRGRKAVRDTERDREKGRELSVF